MIQTEQTSAEGQRAVLFPEAELPISGDVTDPQWPGNEGCRGNFLHGHTLQIFFKFSEQKETYSLLFLWEKIKSLH